ncbi:hypothetical protein [Candidatus Avelusimicrobium fimicolum]|uniref:hypothetical protein n=1 Tax=Candidatus Avelusimicrobium fimicolum TaxID=3416216 RepID=UPI003D0C4E36
MGYRSFGYQPRQFQYPARRKEDLEHQLQVEICNFLDTQMLFHKLAYFAVPNALKFLSTLGSSHKIAAAYNKMRAEGFKDGVSDLVVVLKGQNGLKVGFFEQKRAATYKISEKTGKRIINTPAGKTTESQETFLAEVRKLGAFGAVSFTLEEFKSHWATFIAS